MDEDRRRFGDQRYPIFWLQTARAYHPRRDTIQRRELVGFDLILMLPSQSLPDPGEFLGPRRIFVGIANGVAKVGDKDQRDKTGSSTCKKTTQSVSSNRPRRQTGLLKNVLDSHTLEVVLHTQDVALSPRDFNRD
jgi:hypothetical protein